MTKGDKRNGLDPLRQPVWRSQSQRSSPTRGKWCRHYFNVGDGPRRITDRDRLAFDRAPAHQRSLIGGEKFHRVPPLMPSLNIYHHRERLRTVTVWRGAHARRRIAAKQLNIRLRFDASSGRLVRNAVVADGSLRVSAPGLTR